MVLISNFFIDFSMNEKIITKLLEFQTSNWNISRIQIIDPRNLPADSCFVSLYLPESAGLASVTEHFFFFVTLCYARKSSNTSITTATNVHGKCKTEYYEHLTDSIFNIRLITYHTIQIQEPNIQYSNVLSVKKQLVHPPQCGNG